MFTTIDAPARRRSHRGATVDPHVLADGDRDVDAADAEQRLVRRPRVEVALLVEDAVVRQRLLAVAAHDASAVQDRRGVPRSVVGIVGIRSDDAVPLDPTDDRGAVTVDQHRQPLELVLGVLDERGLQHQVLGRVAAHGELGEHRHVRAGSLGTSIGVGHDRHVAVQVAHPEVQLEHRDPDALVP